MTAGAKCSDEPSPDVKWVLWKPVLVWNRMRQMLFPSTDTEEFIEDKYPVDIRYSLNLDCTVTQMVSLPEA